MSRRRRTWRLAALGTVAVLSLPVAVAEAAPTGTLTPATAFDFGGRQIGAGPSGTRTFTVTSTGSDPLEIASVSLTGPDAEQFAIVTNGCAAASPLAPGQTCTVQVVFAPVVTGARTTTLEVATNGPTLTSASLAATGRDLQVSAASASFGRLSVGTTSEPQTVTLTNGDSAPYTLGAVSLAGSAAAQFAKPSDSCSSATLAPGGSCTLDLTFAPTSLGPKAATLSVAGYGPAPVSLGGEGAQAAASVAPATRDFGARAPGSGPSAAQPFTLTNSGNEPLALGAVELIGPDAARFSIAADGCSDATVAPGGECVVQVAFAPVVAGWRTASLRIPRAGGNAAVARVSGRGSGAGVDTDAFGPLDLAFQPLLRLQGDGGDTAGAALASGACDVNADGYDDVLSGAPLWSRTPAELSWEGAVYVYLGGPEAGGADLAAAGGARVVRIEGEQPSSQTGTGVGCAGDVNGDGVDDIAVGAWAYEHPGRPPGTGAPRGVAYVVFGSADLAAAGPLDLGHLGEHGFRIEAPEAEEYDHLGYAVTGVGDLDGDGLGDLAVMANTGDTTDAAPARSNNGLVFVVRGRAGTATVDVATSGATLMTIHGASPGSAAAPFGQMNDVAGIGDVNGDGTADVGIGSYTAVAFGRSTASGAAFAISGERRGRVDLADPDAPLLAIGGAFAGHRLGISIDGAGDVNGDGLGDVVVGADSTASANSDAAYVVFGSESPGLVDAADLGARGYRILGATGSSSGFSVAGIGDADGDGHDDLLVGAYALPTDAGNGTGSAWIVHGQPDPEALPANDADSGLVPANAADHTHYLALGELTAAQGSRVDGVTAGERFARQVAAVGDVDGNGAADVAFGADQAFRHGRTSAGEVTVALLPGPAPAYEPPEEPEQPQPEQPGPGGRPQAPPPQGDPPPAGSLGTPTLVSRRMVVDRSGRVPLRVRCARATVRCTGRAVLRLGGKRLRSVRFSVEPGHSRRVRVRLPRSLRRSLARKGRLEGTVAFTVRGTAAIAAVKRTVHVVVRARSGR
jgi:hypothetical protein